MIERTAILGVVLAGGKSRRMGGGDKALMALAGQPLIGRVIAHLAPQVRQVSINANSDPARFAGFGLPVFADTLPGHPGPLAGVLAAMRFATTHDACLTHVVTVATDTPFFPDDLVTRLAQRATKPDTIAMARSAGRRHPVFALWPIALADDLQSWLNGTDTFKVMVWVERHGLAEVDFPADHHDPFFNINTPQDRQTAEKRLLQEAAS